MDKAKLQKKLLKHPNSAELNFTLGKLNFYKGEYEKAYEYFTKVSEIDSEFQKRDLLLSIADLSFKLDKEQLERILEIYDETKLLTPTVENQVHS